MCVSLSKIAHKYADDVYEAVEDGDEDLGLLRIV